MNPRVLLASPRPTNNAAHVSLLMMWQAHQTSGYCGADLKLLCVEAALRALRTRYPQIYRSQHKLVIDMEQVVPARKDFAYALDLIVPASHRAVVAEGCELPKQLQPLLGDVLTRLVAAFQRQVGRFLVKNKGSVGSIGAGGGVGGGGGGAALAASGSGAAGGRSRRTRRVDFNTEELRVVYGIINDETCLACKKGGELVCCDTCAAAIHLECVHPTHDMPVDTETDAPWFCQQCRDKQVAASASSSSSSSRSSSASSSSSSAGGAFAPSSLEFERANCFVRSALVHTHRPCVILHGQSGDLGQRDLAAAFLASLEGFAIYSLSLPTLMKQAFQASPAHACASIVDSARRSGSPSVVYVPLVDQWWGYAPQELRAALLLEIESTSPGSPMVFLFTAGCSAEKLDRSLLRFFGNTLLDGNLCVELRAPKRSQRHAFFEPLIAVLNNVAAADREALANAALVALQTPRSGRTRSRPRGRPGSTIRTHSSDVVVVDENENDGEEEEEEELALAPPEEPRGPSMQDLHRQRQQNQRDEHYLRELRVFFRDGVLRELYKDPKYKYFREMVNLDELPDYMDHIETPMFFDEMRMKVDEHLYTTYEQFREDLELIRDNAIEYNGVQTQRGRRIVSQVGC